MFSDYSTKATVGKMFSSLSYLRWKHFTQISSGMPTRQK